MTSLASLFYLLSLLLWLQARVQSSRLARLGWILAGLGSAWLGFFTKEILLTLPLVVFLLEITVRGQGRSLRERRAWLVKALAALAGYGILLLLLVPRLNPDVTANVNRLSTQWTARLLTQPRVFWHYLSLLCFPDLSRLSLDPEWTLSQGWLSPGTTLPALLALAALLGLSLSWLGRRPVAALAVLFFLIALAPEAVVPLDPVFDHRLYLPSAGLLGGLGAGWLWPGPRRRARLALFFSSAVFLSCLSYARNATWAEGVRLWQDTVKKSPHKARVWNNLAVKYHARNWIARAVPAYQQAVRLDPDLAEAYQNLGLLYSRLGRVEDARRAAGRVLALKPGDPRALLLLAEVDERAGNRERALEDYRRAWESEPTNPEVLEQLGQGLMALGRPDLAQEVFEALTGLYPDRADAHLLLGNACFEQGRWAEAAAAYSRELERHPEATGVQNNLGMAWLRLHQPDRAAAAFARAASLEPGSALFQANLCEAEADLGQLEAATAACRKAVSLEPSLGFAWKLLANLYLRQGRDAEAQQALDQARKLGE
jgi:tetratricopeptide (TPR) repeat protein